MHTPCPVSYTHLDVYKRQTYLWCMGCCPQLSYHDEVWDTRRTTEDMVAWCTNRAKLHKSLTEAQEKSIRDYVERQATGGMVLERTRCV